MKKKKVFTVFVTLASIISFASDASAARKKIVYSHTGSHHTSHVLRQHSSYKKNFYKHKAPHIIQCVAYVHSASDFKIHGDAKYWWGRASGLYERGHIPEKDAVLAFKPIRRMKLGHVAIVNRIIDGRTITINQAHWGENRIVHDVKVIDVSQKNNWSAVRVELSHSKGNYGNLYPTHGFIYHRPVGSIRENNDLIAIDNNVQLSELPQRNSKHNYLSDAQDEKPPSSLM